MANEIRTIRKSLKLTQAEFAEMLGVTKITVWRWENGKAPIAGPVLIAARSLAPAQPSPALRQVDPMAEW